MIPGFNVDNDSFFVFQLHILRCLLCEIFLDYERFKHHKMISSKYFYTMKDLSIIKRFSLFSYVSMEMSIEQTGSFT